MTILINGTTFASLFRKYRLHSEIDTLAEFGDLLAQEGMVYETSLFTRWQKGERVPRDRKALLAIVRVFLKKGGIKSIDEINALLEAANQGYATSQEYAAISHFLSLHKFQLNDVQENAINLLAYNNKTLDAISSNEKHPSDKISQPLLKVYFAGSYKEEAFSKSTKFALYNEIKHLGYKHVDDDFIEMSYAQFIQQMKKGKQAIINHYQKKISSILKADICIFEVTIHSLGIGFLIQKSIDAQKPTIVLYYKDNIPFFLSGIVEDELLLYSYNDNNYKKILQNSLNLINKSRH